MKKTAKIKRKTIRFVVKNLIVFAILIAVAAVGVRSWMRSPEEFEKSNASGLTLNCHVPEGLEIAIVPPGGSITSETVWHRESFTISAQDYPFISALSFTEVTGDGKSFVKPKIMQYGSVAVADTNNVSEWASATANSEYLSLDIYFRTTASDASVKLDKETYCGPESSTQQWGDNTNGWSPHTVIGASRVAVEELNLSGDSTTMTQKLLWIPAPFLHFDPVSRNGDAQLIQNITDPTNNYGLDYYDSNDNIQHNHQDGTYNHGYYTKSGNTATRHKITYSSNVADAGTKVTAYPPVTNGVFDTSKRYLLPYDVPITQFSSDSTAVYNNVTYYQKAVRINIWIEGEDPESRSAQITGAFKTVLNFKL